MKLATVISVGLLIAATGLVSLVGRPSPSKTLDAKPAPSTRPLTLRTDLPVSFEVNQGQTAPQVKFLARGKGFTVFFTPEEVVLVLGGTPALSGQARTEVLRSRLVEGNPSPTIEGEQPLAGHANYFTGSDPARWRTNVAMFGRVRYRDVYPGVDLIYYGVSGRLEYDFEIRPGADPAKIRLSFEGAERLVSEESGLLLQTRGGTVRHRSPTVYQAFNGGRRTVPASFRLISATEVGFAVGSYDTAKPLVLDPVLDFSTYLGGSSSDSAYSGTLDDLLNTYITGPTLSINFPTSGDGYDPTCGLCSASNRDIFVTKVSADGSEILYSTYIGGLDTEYPQSIAVASDTGAIYLTGLTLSGDFPTTLTPYAGCTPGISNVFVLVLRPWGQGLSDLQYSTSLLSKLGLAE